MRALDLFLRWHARRIFKLRHAQPVGGVHHAETNLPKDNVYPLW